ncbi:MAG: hypothetical protein EP312_10090 [Gammaproteobacteria bacterium]|nr:MAG: hypothetical protein EP312_10090 [Gammaproteobacteria bacterium]
MIKQKLWLLVIYILGCLTLVPWCVWTLFTAATKDNIALLIVLPLAWVISYWPMMGSLVAAWNIHRFMKKLDDLKTTDDIRREFLAHGLDDAVIDMIAHENKLPAWLVRKVIRKLPLEALLQKAVEKDLANKQARLSGNSNAVR